MPDTNGNGEATWVDDIKDWTLDFFGDVANTAAEAGKIRLRNEILGGIQAGGGEKFTSPAQATRNNLAVRSPDPRFFSYDEYGRARFDHSNRAGLRSNLPVASSVNYDVPPAVQMSKSGISTNTILIAVAGVGLVIFLYMRR